MVQFLDPEIVKMDKRNLDAETVEMVWLLDPEIVEKVDTSFVTLTVMTTILKWILWCTYETDLVLAT